MAVYAPLATVIATPPKNSAGLRYSQIYRAGLGTATRVIAKDRAYIDHRGVAAYLYDARLWVDFYFADAAQKGRASRSAVQQSIRLEKRFF